VTGENRYRILQALREHPSAHSVYPFGDTVHFTDARRDGAVDHIAQDLRAFLANRGYVADVVPIAAGIEDSFMALMQSSAA
ncbi:MAG TPA: hypothetical protein VEB19_18935, partial [Gemmatimonadaceae bacterium]|nr:hypothetical protein [Gemmatimonadaceae bacterium]